MTTGCGSLANPSCVEADPPKTCLGLPFCPVGARLVVSGADQTQRQPVRGPCASFRDLTQTETFIRFGSVQKTNANESSLRLVTLHPRRRISSSGTSCANNRISSRNHGKFYLCESSFLEPLTILRLSIGLPVIIYVDKDQIEKGT